MFSALERVYRKREEEERVVGASLKDSFIFVPQINKTWSKGSFKDHVDKIGWVGG